MRKRVKCEKLTEAEDNDLLCFTIFIRKVAVCFRDLFRWQKINKASNTNTHKTIEFYITCYERFNRFYFSQRVNSCAPDGSAVVLSLLVISVVILMLRNGDDMSWTWGEQDLITKNGKPVYKWSYVTPTFHNDCDRKSFEVITSASSLGILDFVASL